MEGQSWPQYFYAAEQPLSQSIESADMPSDLASSPESKSLYSMNNTSAYATPYPATGDRSYTFAPYPAASNASSSTYPASTQFDSSFYSTNTVPFQASPSYDLPGSSYHTIQDRSRSVSIATPAVTETSSYSASHIPGSRTDSMASMLYRCLLEAPNHTRSLKQIYTWVERECNKPANSRARWTNTLRHNLSQNGDFQSLAKSYWTLTPEALAHGPTPTSEWRRKEAEAKRSKRVFSSVGVQQLAASADSSALAEDIFDFSCPPSISTLPPRAMPSAVSEIADFTTTPQTQAHNPYYTTTAPDSTPNYAFPTTFELQHGAPSQGSWMPHQATSPPTEHLYNQPQNFQQMDLLAVPSTSSPYNSYELPHQQQQQQQYQPQAPHAQQFPFQVPQSGMIDPLLAVPAQHNDFMLLDNATAQFPTLFPGSEIPWMDDGKGEARAE